MNEKLVEYKEDQTNSSYFRTELLCMSLGKIPVPLVTITD